MADGESKTVATSNFTQAFGLLGSGVVDDGEPRGGRPGSARSSRSIHAAGG
jgi:hypothetical protein